MAQDILDDPHAPFEGPEKLLEIWFKPSANNVPDADSPSPDGRIGLRKIHREVWEEMLSTVKCQVLSAISGTEMDAYLLSESSLFVAPHRLILKTCGTTLNLLGLPRILEIAASQARMTSVYRCFYSRKSFMFPDRQLGPHRDWKQEVEYLNSIFETGSAYTVGKMDGDHWLLYITDPSCEFNPHIAITPTTDEPSYPFPDYTLEILMSNLEAGAREPFFTRSSVDRPRVHSTALSDELGITNIFPSHLTTLDAYSFLPCGYSANALIKWNHDSDGAPCEDGRSHGEAFREGYYTIHVTPEAGWSYASFECNVPCHFSKSTRTVPDLGTLVQRVVTIFKPGRLSLTLFISKKDDDTEQSQSIELAQQAFKLALIGCRHQVSDSDSKVDNRHPQGMGGKGYKRTDKINYEFGDYDLAFASFELIE